MNAKNSGLPEDENVLSLLSAVEKQADLSQRNLSQQMGVALGLTNSYMKRCIRKGWVKIKTAPANRYFYYLTPAGFAEKSRLTARFLSNSLSFYREAGDSCVRVFRDCANQDARTILLAGDSDLAEIATLRAIELGVEIKGVYDRSGSRKRCAGRPVWLNFSDAPAHSAIVITDLADPGGMLKQVQSLAKETPVFVPDILRFG